MSDAESLWKGYGHTCHETPGEAGVFRVTIYPRGLMKSPDSGGKSRRVPASAAVHVRAENTHGIVHYSPPEKPDPDRGRADFERKAVEIVKGRLAQQG